MESVKNYLDHSNDDVAGHLDYDEENTFNIYKQESSLEMILENSKKLDKAYDRFVAEIELLEN
jgi:hypothetical protein